MNHHTTPRRDIADDADIERCLIGSVLLDARELDVVSGIVSQSDFLDTQFGEFFSALVDRHDAGQPTGDAALLREVGRSIFGNDAAATIAELFRHEPTARHARYYAEKVKSASRLRELADIAGEIVARSTCATETVESIIAYAGNRLDAIGTQNANKAVTLHDAGNELIAELRQPQTRRPITTGIASVDNVAGGLLPGELEIIAARPSKGKTALAMQVAKNSAEQSRPVLFVSLEMKATELVARVLCSESGVDSRNLRRGQVDPSRIEKVNAELAGLPFTIYAPHTATMQQIRAIAKMQQAAGGLDLLIVDYIGLVQPRDRRQQRHEQVAEITAALKRLAKELNIPVIALCQLNRQADGAEPRLSHLRESGSIEQDADVVLFLHPVDGDNATNEVKLIVGKHRHGDTGAIPLTFDAAATRFSDVATQRFDQN